MITNFHLGQDGRLGNQLFQYAALKSLALEKGYDIGIPDPATRIWHNQPCLLGSFNIKCDIISDFSGLEYQYIEPSITSYDENFFDLPDNVTIKGVFQNLAYFKKYKDILCAELTVNSTIAEKANIILNKYKQQYPFHEMVSVHIRRGDNVTCDIEMGKRMFGSTMLLDPNSVWGSYFNRAKKEFEGKNVKYLLFTGGNHSNNDDADIEWLKHNFNSDDYIIISSESPLIDYSLISQCEHNILCHVTSFGWWSAYTNINPNKKMIIPKDYFLDGSDASRLIDENFIAI